jgi:hypothetical protein
MNDIDVVLGLLVVVATLATMARRIGVPAPILMVLGGIAIGFRSVGAARGRVANDAAPGRCRTPRRVVARGG